MPADKNQFYIIDDDESVCRSLRALLATYGFSAKSFTCAEDFFSTVPNSSPGCLLLDLHLPAVNGWEIQQRLSDSGSKRPVIIITADEDAGLMKRAFQAGAMGFLHKPFKSQELVDLIYMAF